MSCADMRDHLFTHFGCLSCEVESFFFGGGGSLISTKLQSETCICESTKGNRDISLLQYYQKKIITHPRNANPRTKVRVASFGHPSINQLISLAL